MQLFNKLWKRLFLLRPATTPIYARIPVSNLIKDRLDAVHKAQHVGKRDRFIVQNLDAATLGHTIESCALSL